MREGETERDWRMWASQSLAWWVAMSSLNVRMFMKRAPRYIYTYIVVPGGLSVCVCLPSFHRCAVAESFACCL